MTLNDPDQVGVNLAHQNLRGANLAGRNLQRAVLVKADLSDANLAGANLAGAILQGALLKNADLSGTNLAGAYLPWADLTGATLDLADLSNANLESAVLADASLAGVRLTKISYTRATIWPAGFKPSKSLTPSPGDVQTLEDLLDHLTALARGRAIDANPSLERYLQSLHKLLVHWPTTPPSPSQVAQWFTEALDADHDQAPLGDAPPEPLTTVSHVLAEQCAELRTYAASGNLSSDWANLLPEDYLAAAARGYAAHSGGLTSNPPAPAIGLPLRSLTVSWQAVADLLELGKVYE